MQGGWIGCSVSIRRRTEHGNNHCVCFSVVCLPSTVMRRHKLDCAGRSSLLLSLSLSLSLSLFLSLLLSLSSLSLSLSLSLTLTLTLTLALPPSLVGPPYASSPFSSQRMCWCFSGTSSMLCHSTQCASLTHQLCVGGRLGWPLSGFACIEETELQNPPGESELCVHHRSHGLSRILSQSTPNAFVAQQYCSSQRDPCTSCTTERRSSCLVSEASRRRPIVQGKSAL